MGKQYKGKQCVYCLETPATTMDHVFSREFFVVEDRDHLPKAPACKACNGAKSALEHYLTAVLPFGGRHAQAQANLETQVPPRLAKNRPLSRQMLESTKPAWIRQDGGIYQPTRTAEFDGDKLQELLRFVGRGLAWHHWKVYLRGSDRVTAMLMTDAASALFQGIIGQMRPENRVAEDWGRGTVQYVGLQAADPPQITVWTISMYGGILLSDDRTTSGGESISGTTWWVITGPRELAESFARLN